MSEYDSDLVLWSREQADLLRRMGVGERVNDQVDWENVAEEIESLGNSDRRDLSNRTQTILRHLIKLAVSPANQPRAGWKRTVVEQRSQIARLLKDSPSLRQLVPAAIAEEMADARALALLDLAEFGEQPSADPGSLMFSEEQVLGPELPD
jgi:1,6-anhydro-N-acetylmuramate kinase